MICFLPIVILHRPEFKARQRGDRDGRSCLSYIITTSSISVLGPAAADRPKYSSTTAGSSQVLAAVLDSIRGYFASADVHPGGSLTRQPHHPDESVATTSATALKSAVVLRMLPA